MNRNKKCDLAYDVITTTVETKEVSLELTIDELYDIMETWNCDYPDKQICCTGDVHDEAILYWLQHNRWIVSNLDKNNNPCNLYSFETGRDYNPRIIR